MRSRLRSAAGPAGELTRTVRLAIIGGVGAVADLQHGRNAHADRAWADAFSSLAASDAVEPLAAEDLELLATAAYMLGREEEYLDALERAHSSYLDAGHALAAVRCAFWIGLTCALRGDAARASGWLARAERLLEHQDGDHVERGYLLLPRMFELEAGGDWEGAAAAAEEAGAIGERFGDADLFALATHERGHILIRDRQAAAGLRLLDEAMVGVTAGELSPIVSGIVYCGVILACQEAHDVRRAHEWTAALTQWCERQPDLVAFTGRCLVHRAEIMQLHGEWTDAREEAHRAAERCLRGQNQLAAGEACYREAEIDRLVGRFEAAESKYREASRHGREPQPGLALLRLAQGRIAAAAAAIGRAGAAAASIGRRVELLAAEVEIMLTAGDREAARAACDELDAIAAGHRVTALDAVAAQARGATLLADREATAALEPLREAVRGWQELGVPYEAARARELLGFACRALGDDDAAALELDAARAAFAELGAAPDLARIGGPEPAAGSPDPHGLTEREREVLGLLAAGATNKAIAEDLVLSVRTVDRHVSNIYAKLGVSSRAAATAHAHRHGLV